MKCPSCGKTVPAHLQHCAYCGAQISDGSRARGAGKRSGGCGCRGLGLIAGLAVLLLLLIGGIYQFFWQSGRAPDYLLRLDSSSSAVSAIAFSRTGDTLAAGTEGGEILLWHMPDGALERTMGGDGGAVRGLEFLHDGVTLVSATKGVWQRSGQVRVWNVAEGIGSQIIDLSLEQGSKNDAAALALSFDGRQLALGTVQSRGGMVELWNVAGWARTDRWETSLLSDVTFSPDASMLAVAMNDGTVELWLGAGGRIVRTFAHGSRAEAVAFSPDGSQLVTAGGQVVKLWRIEGGTLVREMTGFDCSASSVVFAPDGALIAAGSSCLGGGHVTLWNTNDGAMVSQMAAEDDGVEAIAFSPNGELIASGDGHVVYVWRVP